MTKEQQEIEDLILKMIGDYVNHFENVGTFYTVHAATALRMIGKKIKDKEYINWDPSVLFKKNLY